MRKRFDLWDEEGDNSPSEPDARVSDRDDQVIYGPRGDVVAVVKDRPFRGYRRGDHA